MLCYRVLGCSCWRLVRQDCAGRAAARFLYGHTDERRNRSPDPQAVANSCNDLDRTVGSVDSLMVLWLVPLLPLLGAILPPLLIRSGRNVCANATGLVSLAALALLLSRAETVFSGVVKWFDVAKGFGFIVPDNGIQDVLLHVSCLRRDGYQTILEGTRIVALIGMKLPMESHVLQAFVSEGLKPFIDCVCTFGAGHFYVSQSDKGGLVFGGDIDGYNSYAQRGNLATVEHVAEAGKAMIPGIAA